MVVVHIIIFFCLSEPCRQQRGLTYPVFIRKRRKWETSMWQGNSYP